MPCAHPPRAAAAAPGAHAALANAGVTDEATLLSPDNKVHPDYYMSQLPELLSVKQAVAA
jgi:hypothetical protein